MPQIAIDGHSRASSHGPHHDGPQLRTSGREEETLERLFDGWQRHHDPHAREMLVEHYMPLARRLARRYLSAREPIEDLLQVASLGLLKAIDRFDTSRGNRFAAFAVPTILGELRRHFRTVSWAVHVPRGAQERALEVDKASSVLRTRCGRAPTVREIAEYLELDEPEVLDALQTTQAQDALSLDAPLGGEEDRGGDARSETIGSPDDGYAYVEDSSAVAQALARLPPRERKIVQLRFVAEMTQSEIAERVGLSQMQVSRLLRRSLREMRELAGG